MTKEAFMKAIQRLKEVELTVTGRKSGRSISTPVWFVQEADKLYLLPVTGSDSSWYRNVVAKPTISLAAKGEKLSAQAKTVTDSKKVKEVVEKFRAKYGAGEIRKYYSKFDVCVEVTLD